MEYILNNILLALLEFPNSTLLGVNRMLADKEYRKKVVENIHDVSVKAFWTEEFAKYGDRYMQEAGAAIQNKVGQFIANPLVRNIIGQPKSSFDLRKMMDERKIFIVNLSKGRVGEQNANLLGSMFVTKVYLAAMSRADANETMLRRLPNFYLYVDEFQSFANESFADILSEARKYKLNLTIAHQYIEQMSEEVRAAVFGNVGTMVSFRVGAYDAEVLEKEFAPQFTAEDMVNLGFTQIYLKLMIDGVTSPPFSATTLPPIPAPPVSFRDDIIEHTRQKFAVPRALVEESIKEWSESYKSPAPEKKFSREKPAVASGDYRKAVPVGAGAADNKPAVSSEARKSEGRYPARVDVGRDSQKDFHHRETAPKKFAPRPEKSPSEENRSSLRDALAGVLKEVKEKEAATAARDDLRQGAFVPNKNFSESKPSAAASPKVSSNQDKNKGVPEEILRQVLKVEGHDKP